MDGLAQPSNAMRINGTQNMPKHRQKERVNGSETAANRKADKCGVVRNIAIHAITEQTN